MSPAPHGSQNVGYLKLVKLFQVAFLLPRPAFSDKQRQAISK
ncbi:hypothetical protein EIKCOROL_01738 [Eikenella corrodens ATCC 23834]|uniref:Uncharacterized protein n=1 Tax=Eikenella corrodens ATCC 23834 TaxID=546274 RepID=C0DWI6_EIKCO|nr:hypothetical protein EIKCOROL_01738 [Eikenella corrodens ATCC 23834]